MATKTKQPDTGSDATSLDSLKEQVTRLQSDLEAERRLTRQLRREKSYDVQKTRELEQTKASIALKDQRAKLHQERIQELELQKDALARRHDLDLQKVVRQKDGEIGKLRADLRRCQDELELTRERATNRNNSGLSATSARGAFDAERQKLLTDIQELRTARRHLEGELRTAAEAERQRCREVQDLKSQLRIETAKIQREADTEIKRLLEELRSKDRQSWQKQKESSTQTDYFTGTKLLMDTPPVSPDAAQLANGVRENGETESAITGSVLSESKGPTKKDPGGVLQQKVKELTSRVKELEEEKQSLAEDKTQLQQKIKDMEKKHRTTLEKNKRFLEKNIEVTNINRSLEEKIKRLNDELNKLRSQSEKFKKEQDKLSEQLSSEKVDKQTLAELRAELEDLREQAEHQEKTITALKMACNEKDRRIELLVHKRRKQKNSKIQQKMVRFILPAKTHSMASGLKETYYGYDEDTTSIDSEMSSTSCLSSSHLSLDTSNEEDDVFDEVTRSDLERSYQRLMKEHLELEKSYALLQAKAGASHIDPQRDNKDMGWFEEKETLTKTIRMLKDKIKNQEAYERKMTSRISEIQEQNEELEFRILELEEVNEKLKEDVNDTITIKEPPQMTDDGVLQMYAEEKGLMEIKLETIREKLHDLNYSKDGHLDKADKLVLLQARAMLGIADKKLKDLTTTQDLLKARIKKLEAEKVELLSAATGVSADLVFEYEETRKKLEEAEQKIKDLEEQMEKHKETEAVYKYTEEQNQRVQSQYKKEISNLQRQLSNSQEGREYESELWHETLEKIKNYERRIQELEAESEPLKERVELLQIENSHLQCGLTQLQCENSRLQCENTQLLQAGSGESTQPSQADSDEKTRNLESKIEEYEKVISDHVGKNTTLEDELKVCKEKLNKAEKREEEFNKKTADLEKELKETLERCCHLENEIENIRAELLKEMKLEGKDTNIHSGVKLLIKQINTLSEEKEALQKKVDELSEKNSHLLQQLEEKASLLEELKQKLNMPEIRADVQDKAADSEKLLEDNNKLKEDNRKLFEDIKKLKEDRNRLEEKNSKLQEDNKSLNEDNERLREQLEKTQKDAENEIIQLNTQSRTLIEKVKSLELKLKESRDEELKMKDSIVLMEEEKSRYIQHLQSQLDQTEENESQLYQTINELKEKEKSLMEELNKKEQALRDKMATIQAEDKEEAARDRRKLQEKVEQLEKREEELMDMARQLEEVNRSLKAELDQIHKAEVKVVKEKKQTVELSVNTDENLVEVEELRKELNSKKMLIDEYRKKVDESEAQQRKLQENLNRVNKQLETVIKELEEKGVTIEELKNDNKVKTLRMNEHEKTAALLRDELSKGKEVISEKEAIERRLEHDLEQARSTVDQLSSKVTELENNNAMLHSKLTGLESLKNDLLETIKKSAQRTHDHGIQTSSTATDPEQLQKDNHDPSQNLEDVFSSPSRFEDLCNMPREQMIARIQELEQMRASDLKKIKELSDNLSSFRQAVEVVAITLETDSTMPLHSSKSKLRDQDLEQRIRQLCKSELILNLKYLEQEKREASLRLQLHETEVTLKKQTKEYRDAIQELEEELDRARKNEARLKNKLQYGGWTPEDHSLAKIQHLEELVFDLEASERRLKRLLQESQDNEEELKRRLAAAEATRPGGGGERFSGLLPDILDNGTDPDRIRRHVADVERAERRLRQKLDQLLEQEASTNFEEDQTLISSDQPEAALRQKVHELEIIQKVLKHEVVELEQERAQLDEITRKDKGLIHDLNVKIMKLEQAERNLKEQLERLEEADRSSNLKIDELQNEISQLQNAERQLKAQLVRAESKETTLSMQLEHAKEDAQRTELKHKQKISELEKERKQLIAKADELTDELGDLHGVEMSLKQKVRNLENTEVTLRSKIEELETALRTARKRVEELESFNEMLSQKIQKLEEEKSAMRFEMSDLVVMNNKNSDQLNERLKQLQTENKQLREIKACGHDEELARLRKEINRLSSLSQAHEVLKSNHDHTKKKLTELERQLAKAQEKPPTKCKYIQVKLTDSFSIHDLEPVICSRCSAYDPEFKRALKNLGARHPEAYQDFVRTLQPPEGRYRTVMKVTGQTDSPTATLSSPPPQSSHPHHSTQCRDVIQTSEEDLVVARRKPTEVKANDEKTTQTQGAQSKKDKVTEESRNPAVRKKYIGQLVDALLLADSETTSEAPLWQVVETFDHEEDEKPYWAEVEVRPVDTMTLSLDVWGLTTDESSSEASGAPCHPSGRSSEAPSVGSDVELPPLPKSVPPLRPPQHSSIDSFCLPGKDDDHLDGDSADEAPDIVDEDDGLSPLKDAPRAKSVERDSDFSEGSSLVGSLRRHKKRRQMAGSLDSIQDSGHGSLKEDCVIKTMRERIAELEAKIEANKKESSELRSKDILLSDCTNLKKDNHHLKSVLEQKSNELALKVREVEELCEKLKRLQSELTRIQQENTADKKSLTAAEDQLKKLKDIEKMYTKLQQEHEELKTKHDELRDKYDSLKEASEDVVSKKKLITELQTKLSAYNKLTLELQSSETKVRTLEQKLKDMAQTETSITRQNVKLLHEVDSLKQLAERYQALEEHYNKVKSKFDEALQVRSDALKMVAPLRAKVIRYAKKCKSKDELIHRLMSEMRRCGQHGELTTKAERMLDNYEDYDRPISPMTSQMIQDIEKDLKEKDLDVGTDYRDQLCETAKLSGSPSLIQASNFSDIEALLDKNKPELIHSQVTDNQRRSEVSDLSHVNQVTDDITDVPPQMSLPPVTQLKCAPDYLSLLDTPKASHTPDTDRQTSSDPSIYVAVNDYNPDLFSTSGQQHREIPLKEGDTVKVLSPANDRGYYEAEVKGQVGLVPALYLVPSTYSKVLQPKVKGYQPPSEVVNSSPEQILTMYAELAKSHVPKFTVPTTCQQPDTPVQSRKPSVSGRSTLIHPAFTKSSSVPSKSPLSPSCVVHPAYHRGNQSCDPATVNTSSSSSSPSSVVSSRCCSPLKIICCQSSATGLQSPPPIDHVRALHKALPLVGPPEPPSDFHVDRIIGDHSVLLSWQPPAMDVFARSNGITIKGYKVYINGKDSQMIPSAHMSKAFIESLNLRQGRTTFSIQTVGDNGQTSRLVEAICVDSTLTDQSTDTDYSRDKSNKHSENGDKKRLCFAVYDYEPSKHSANQHPTEELSLKAGDVVITYGSQREDGFYHGKVHGKKGLVPASFIEEVPVFTYKNRRSTSSNASQVSSLVSRSGSTAGSSCNSIATSDRSRPSSNHSNRSTSSTSSRRRSSRKYQAAV